MMKTRILFLLFCITLLAACTTNNGTAQAFVLED